MDFAINHSMLTEPLKLEISALERYQELNTIIVTDNPSQIVRLAGECSEFIFKSVCIREFKKSETDKEIWEPLKFLNNRDGVNFFYKEYDGEQNPKFKRIQKISNNIAPLTNIVKHAGGDSAKSEAEQQKATISEIVAWYFTDIVDYQNLNIIPKYKRLLINAISLTPSNIPTNLEIITPETFQKEQISDKSNLNKLTVDYFLRFSNNPNHIKKVVANEIHIVPGETFNIRVKSENKELSIENIISNAGTGQPVLLKIMAVGGVGKSTLLWHLMKKLTNDYSTFFLKLADPNSLQYIFQELAEESNKPVLFFLDDVVSNEENRNNLVAFAEKISETNLNIPIVLVASERFYRYDKFKSKRDFEKQFLSENIFTLNYSNTSIRDEVFEKVFSVLMQKHNISEDIKKMCKKAFNNLKSDSLIDRIISLILYLKTDSTLETAYTFDWEDWETACAGKYEELNELFKVVAFFNQFGIQVPIDYLKTYFKKVRNIDGLLNDLLAQFGEDYSPIVYSVMESGETGLALRHEKLGEWYFKSETNGDILAKSFFDGFLSNVKSKSSGYLFRNLIRKNSEFQLSPFSKGLTNEKILGVINKYLEKKEEHKYNEEEYKMLMEKHFVLLNLGEDKKAIEPLEKTIELKPDNVFALVRLASFIQDSDFERAEKLFKEALNYEPENSYATIGLYNLYYKYPTLKQFDILEKEVFCIANRSLHFSNVLLQSIKINFPKLRKSTIQCLHELYATYNLLGNDIAELFMRKEAFNDSYIVLERLKNDAGALSKKYRGKTIHLLIQLYQTQNGKDDRGRKWAEEILKSHTDENDLEAIFFNARILTLDRKTAKFKRAEKFFINAFEQNKSAKTFFAITKFYRDYVKLIRDKDRTNTPKAIITLLKGIVFIRKRLETLITNKLSYEIELCIFLNELAQLYYYHSLPLKGNSKKYISIISSIEEEIESLLNKNLTELKAKINITDTNSYSNYLIDEYDIQLHSKVCDIAHKYYSNKIKRTREFHQKEPYWKKSKEILSQSLAFDKDNPNLLISLIDVKISLGDSNTEEYIKEIDFSKSTVKQKAKLSKILITNGFRKKGIDRINKYGQLNSTDITVKNDLAFCYIEANLWGYAIEVLSDLKNANELTLKNLQRLALELPTDSDDRANAKIKLSETYIVKANNICYEIRKENKKAHSEDNIKILKKYSSGVRQLRKNICRTLFVTGKTKESFEYFKKNRYHIDSLETKELNPYPAFIKLSNYWQGESVDNLSKKISIAETMIDQQARYDDGLKIISDTLNDLLSLKLDFNLIIYNFRNENPFRENIKAIIIKSINMLYTMIELRTNISEQAFEESFRIVKQFENPLFNKIFVNKLIKSESKTIFYKCIPILKHLENNKKTSDPDIVRMLGRCYMMNEKFPQAKNLFNIGLTLSQNNKQKCYSHNNLADWIVTKIEKEGLKSFGNENSIKKKIGEAEQHIIKSKEYFPEFQYQEGLINRLNNIKQCYS